MYNNILIEKRLNTNDYNMVNYVLGNEDRRNYTLNNDEVDIVKNYLKQGENLFISGLDFAYDLDIKGDSLKQEFCHDYLKFCGASDKPNELSGTYYNASFSGFYFF